MFINQAGVRVHNQGKKKGMISSDLEGTSLVNKGFIVSVGSGEPLWDTERNPKQTRSCQLAHLGSQSQCRIWSELAL